MSIDAGTIAPAAPVGPKAAQPETAQAKRSHPTLPISLATIAAIIAAWSLASAYGIVSPLFLPSPLTVLRAIYNVAINGFVDSTLAQHTFASLLRIFTACRLDRHWHIGRPCHRHQPHRQGHSTSGRRIPAAFAAACHAAADHPVDRCRREIGTRRLHQCRPLLRRPPPAGPPARDPPGAVPSILTGTRVALGAGCATLVTAELEAASQGLGFMIQSAAQFLVTDIVIAGIIVIAAIERGFVPWAHP
jgi:taurine transport system permease protein